MKKMLNTHSISIFINIIALLFFFLVIAATYSQMPVNQFSSIEITILVALLLIVASFTAYIVTKYLSKRLFIILLLGIAFLLRISWAYFMKTPLASDFLYMYDGAVDITKSDYQFTESFYFQKWSYQLGFTSYEAMIIGLFGESPRALKLLNIFYSVGITMFVYLTASKLFNEISGRIAGLFYAFYVPSIIMCSVLTNQHLSTFLYFFAFYLVINKGFEKKYSWITIGLLIALGNIIRPLGSFSLLAIAVYCVIVFFLNRDKKTIVTILKKFSGILIVYLLFQQLISYTVIGLGITDQTLSNKDSLWKFVLGFNQESRGHYSSDDVEYLDQFSLWDERNEKAKELIKERLEDKQKVIVLFKDKFIDMWGSKDTTIYWSLRGIDHSAEFAKFLYKAERVMYLSMIIFSIIGFITYSYKENRYHYLLFLILLLGYAAAHLLIEVQTRYRFDIMPSLFILQGYGVYVFLQLIKKRI
ncbi:MAG: glycosyltransferase family 39 protein [Bacillota bacterium]